MSHYERRCLVNDFWALFEAEAAKCDERDGLINGELAWVAMERDALLHRVNQERQLRHKDRIGYEEFERIENRAVGHVDYSSKLAIGCVELVLDRP